MIHKIITKSILFLLCSFTIISAQDQPIDTVASMVGIEIKTSVDKAEIYIGDLVNYQVIITYDSTLELVPPPLGANLGAFDVKDYNPDQVTKLENGQIRSTNSFVLSTFTTGNYIVPPIPVVFIMPDGSYKALLSEAVPIKVLSMLFNSSDSADIKPLKAQFEFVRDMTSYYIWGGVLFLLLLIAGFFIRRHFKKTDAVVEIIDLRPAWEIAFEQLAFLKQKDYLLEKNYRSFYYQLTEITRSFYGKVYEINFIDMTTEEFLEHFKTIEMSEDIYLETKKYLMHADLVKFAKYIPEQKRAEEDFEQTHQLIESTRVLMIKKMEAETVIANAQGQDQKVVDDKEIVS